MLLQQKKALLLLFLVAIARLGFAQQELQIHHINIENGDATMIGVYDNATHQYTSKILIDGGQSAAGLMLLPYLQNITGGTAAGMHFNYVILTHYHNDHYTGLLALGTGKITADSLVDPGGYDYHQYFPGQPDLVSEAKPASLTVVAPWTTLITRATTHNFLKGRSQVLESFGTSDQSSLGHKLLIGQLNGIPVTLECVAGWGNTLSNGSTVADPLPAKNNANNFSLAFILRCGEFRYFIGGDLGGSNQGSYIDQEDALIGYLGRDLPAGHATNGTAIAAGHVCGIKADHHGSSNSNDASFLQAARPTIVMTSAGNNANWHLPQVVFIDKLAALQPVSTNTGAGIFNKGAYFTNLYDWGQGKNSLSEAQATLSNKPGISFDYGNATTNKCSYVIKIKPDHLLTESDFEVDRVDISQAQIYTKLGVFLCHRK